MVAGAGSPAAWLLGGLQAGFAIAVLVRSPELRPGTPGQWAAALPSLLLAGLLLRSGGVDWSGGRLVLAAFGAAIAAAGMLSLGRSFAVLPGVRELRVSGAYAVVRHPIYLGESLVAAAAAWGLGAVGAALWLALLGAVVWRIRAEEALLAAEPGWTAWAARVRWRAVPGVW